jgi:hypothetical protein
LRLSSRTGRHFVKGDDSEEELNRQDAKSAKKEPWENRLATIGTLSVADLKFDVPREKCDSRVEERVPGSPHPFPFLSRQGGIVLPDPGTPPLIRKS